MSTEPATLVLFASKQLWPNIHSIEHWGAALKRVLVYHTPDPRASAEPARRLAQFCAERFGALQVIPAVGAATPEAVAQQLVRWREAFHVGPWVLNATGGTKLMFDGAVALRGRPGVRVVYCEFGPPSVWYELGHSADGFPTATPFEMPHNVTDRIPMFTLVRALWQTDALQVTFGAAAEELPVYELTRALVAAGGNWPAAFAAVGIPVDGTAPEPLLERYVAAALLALGLEPENIARGVRQEGPGQSAQQVDIVANHGARVRVFDCGSHPGTVPGAAPEGATAQLRQAALTAGRLGGLGGEVVLLRPTREFTPTEHALAKDLNVRVIDRTDRARLFRQLGTFLGVRELPAALHSADELLAEAGNADSAFPLARG